MILYFSATGNNKYTAQRLASALGETAVSMEEHDGKLSLAPDEMLGIVTPTYWWELPVITRDFLTRLTVGGYCGQYVFVLATYGTTPGAACADAAHLLREKGLAVTARFSVRMPDTWTPMFDLSDREKVAAANAAADAEIDGVIERLKARAAGSFAPGSLPYAVRLVSDRLYNAARTTEHFSVSDACIGCGLCARSCPVNAIELRGGRPVWVKPACAACLRCLHRCPKFAVSYAHKTEKHGQYTHPGVEI